MPTVDRCRICTSPPGPAPSSLSARNTLPLLTKSRVVAGMDHKSAMAFHEVAGETYKKLQTLWDEIGTAQEERTEYMRRLTQDLTHLFHSALKNEQVCSINVSSCRALLMLFRRSQGMHSCRAFYGCWTRCSVSAPHSARRWRWYNYMDLSCADFPDRRTSAAFHSASGKQP